MSMLINRCPLTRSAGRTFFDGDPVVHTDMMCPYSAALRHVIIAAASEANIHIGTTGTYLCVDGPRFETAAEVRLFASWGADVVGMNAEDEPAMRTLDRREVGALLDAQDRV